MKKLFILLVIIISFQLLKAQVPTWNQDVAPIIFQHCTSCHHSDGIAPFRLMNYNQAFQHLNDIGADVSDKKMPPWPPSTSYCHYQNERALTYQDINTILDWVNGGGPEGTGTQPTAPVFTNNTMMSNIDTTLYMPLYTVQTDVDEYRTFVIHSGLDSTRYINEIEFMIGNKSIVHHILIYQDPTVTSWNYDQNDPGPGYNSNGTTTASPYATLITGWAPGDPMQSLPGNFGFKVSAGADYVVEFHFAPGHIGELDSTHINIHYCSGTNVRQVVVSPILYHEFPSLMGGPLFIAADSVETFTERAKFNFDKTLISVGPHMHLIGTSIKSFFVDSAGDTTKLIHIPTWDFHWQGFYNFQHFIKLPAQTYIYANAVYNNTSSNPNNPNTPPIDVSVGEHTTDEMMLVFFAYTDYQPGDENIVVDTTVYNTGIQANSNQSELSFRLIPNPASSEFFIQPSQDVFEDYEIELTNLIGELVLKETFNPLSHIPVNISQLPNGVYFVHLIGSKFNSTIRIVKSY